jgi:hypothetical protein
MGELPAKQNQRNTKMLETKGTVQPYVVLVGKLGDLEAAYVVVNNFLYNVDTATRAVDICFKGIFALHATYPPESKVLWTWMQKCIYKISTKWDVEYTSVNSLISDLSAF